MNKNLVKYPIRFGTLLLAGAALVACKKEEFTEKDAWNLENQRLTRLAQLKKTADSLARVEREGMFKWQRNIDSLNQINKGGRVFYTVIPVNANEAVLSGGRTEEAITGATVTATQFGRTVTGTGANGVFTFPEMRSGEVTVNVTAPNFTQVNYISNLTPDGGIANDGVVNVGNVIPMFELPGTGSNAAARFAVVRGQAWFEGDLTDATAQEERVTPAVLGANTNLVTATIDLDRGMVGSTPSWFHRRFIIESNDENGAGSTVGGTIRSGAIQRFSYSRAVSYGTVDTNGAYSMLVPASAAGLPIRLNYSEFAFNRVYFNTNGQTVNGTGTPAITERFLYGPNVTPTAIPTVQTNNPTLEVQAFTTAAAGTVAFTPQSTGAQSTSFTGGRTEITFPSATDAGTTQAATNRRRGGFYATAPTVTLTGAGTGATFAATLTRATSDEATATATTFSLRNNTAAAVNPTTLAGKADFETAFGTVSTVAITAGGTGYTANGALTFTRTDIVNNAGFGGQAAGGGVAGGYVTLSPTTPIQVTDGGSNFIRNAATTVSTANTFTNFLPTPVFTETNQAGSADPDKGYNSLVPAVTDATARVFVDYDATYIENPAAPAAPNPNVHRGVTAGAAGNGTNGSGVGAIQEVRLTSNGAYPNASLPFVNFSFGQTVSSGGFTATNRNLFLSNGNGGIKFNSNLTAADISALFAGAAGTIDGGAAGTGVTFTTGWGSRYTYVPRVEVVANAAATTVGGATLTNSLQGVGTTVTVNSDPTSTEFGKIVRIVLNSPISVSFAGGAVGADNNDFLAAAPFGGVAGTHQISVRAVPQRYGNTLAAIGGGTAGRTTAVGSALNTYSYSATAQSTSDATTLAAAMGGAVSNTTTTNLTTAQYLAGNNMLVVFSAPNNTTVTGRSTAWGVPTFSGNVLIGARILDGGSGYSAPTTGTVNFTSAVTAQLVPNPWFRGNTPVTGVTGPANLTTGLQVGGVNAGLPVNQDIVSFLNHPVMTAQATAFRPAPAVTRARIVVTLTNQGLGYSRAPRFIVSGGGLNLTPFNNTATSVGGVLTLTSTIDAEGKVVKLSSDTGGLTQVTSTTAGVTTDVLNTFQFVADAAPAYTGTLNLNVVEELSVALTRSLNNSVADGGVGAVVNVGATTAAPTGAVTNVRFGKPTATSAAATATQSFLGTNLLFSTATAPETVEGRNDAVSPRVDIQTGTGAAAFVPGYDSPLVPGPRTIVIGGTGTGATVQSWVTLDPKVAQHRRITAITVTAGGTGYGFVRLNSVTRGLEGSIIPAGGGAQAFQIFGGVTTPGTTGTNGGAYNNLFSETNERFDAHPGRAYVRDVHYGTGVRVD